MGFYQEVKHQDLSDPDLVVKLESYLKDSKVLTPSSDEYGARIKRWSDSSEKRAGAIVLATTAADISATVLFAQAWSIDLVVCGGGHSSSGASSTSGGLVIDLCQMRAVSVDPVSKTIRAQGGCLWADVDVAAYEHGLATVGGTVNHTGIGGLTLGGGYGWLSGEYGLVIDNLLAVQMVLADGSIVTASESENSDLFWAVRGAGQSFGVAVEFTYRAHPQSSTVWAGQLVFLPNNLEALAAAANQLIASSQRNMGLILGFACPPPAFQPVPVAVVYFNGPASAAEEFFAPLLALNPIVNTTASMPYAQLNGALNAMAVHGGRKINKGSTFATPLRPEFFQSVFEDYARLLKQPHPVMAIILFEFLPTDKICAVPHAATAFANRGQYQNVLVSPKWTDPAFDEVSTAWAKEIALKFDAEMERGKREGDIKMEVEGVGQYGNYDDLHQRERGRVIFGPNYDRVLKLKNTYDPNNVFNKAHVQVETATAVK